MALAGGPQRVVGIVHRTTYTACMAVTVEKSQQTLCRRTSFHKVITVTQLKTTF